MWLAAFSMMLAVAACASAPVQDMSNARQAIAAAQQAGAEHMAANEMAEARQLLKKAQTELDNGDYSSARQDAIRARSAAEKALRIAQGNPAPP